MSETPIWMEHDGYGDVPPKHPKPWDVYCRNPKVDGSICLEQLPTIAHHQIGLESGVDVSKDSRLRCALARFFGTDDPAIWEEGYHYYGNDCALVCQPEVGYKTLLHCDNYRATAIAGRPVYYYWKKQDGKPVMNVMATKRFRYVERTLDYIEYCCDFDITWDYEGGYGTGGTRREILFETDRPADTVGFCFCTLYSMWGICYDAPSSSIVGEPTEWFTRQDIAEGAESEGQTYFYAMAYATETQAYISDGSRVKVDHDGCLMFYLSAMASKEAFCPDGWGAPYLYVGNSDWEYSEWWLKSHGTLREPDDLYNQLVGFAMQEQRLPGFYLNDKNKVVFVQTACYRKAITFKTATGCNTYGIRSYGEGVTLDHEHMIAPSPLTGKFDTNPRALYADSPIYCIGGENNRLRFFITISQRGSTPKPGQDEALIQVVFRTKHYPPQILIQAPNSNDFIPAQTVTKEMYDKPEVEFETFITVDALKYLISSTQVKVEIKFNGELSDWLRVSDDWASYQGFAPISYKPTVYDPPVRV